LYLVPIFGARIGAYIWSLYVVPIFGACVVGLESVVGMRAYFGANIWGLYKFGAYIWCLCLEPIFGAYI
jgi:hypothetical protein